jgi:hypothetical protein
MINASFSSIYTSRCKYCAGVPKNYSFRIDKFSSKKIKFILFIKNTFFIKEYLNFKDAIVFINGKRNKFVTTAFNKMDVSMFKNNHDILENRISNCLSCDCGKTIWAYSESHNRRHIMNKRCKYNYTLK